MCGITGFWAEGSSEASIGEIMAAQIKSRGPDDSGVWQSYDKCLTLAHRRLSILDRSPAGSQPMSSICGRYTLVFNGEIYNHHDIRSELTSEGLNIDWRGHSDTETLLYALSHWGVKHALRRLNGMFAFAFWDSLEKVLFLARDRMGEKPLYYGRCGQAFLFGSELKCLKVHPDWDGRVDRDALALYMRHNYVPTPWSIYKGIAKLPPAHYVAIRDDGRFVGSHECYWSLAETAVKGISSGFCGSSQLTDELDALLRDAVKLRMEADVPIGAFLSGGYDSTMIAALMQAQSDVPIQTFTIGFYEEGYNEAVHAKAIADYLGTNHTELYVTPEQALAVIPKLPEMYDEPFADSSQIPTFLVSQLAREYVTVSLSGDGGDELFYGYGRYFNTQLIWGKIDKIPLKYRKLLAAILVRVPAAVLGSVIKCMPKKYQISHLADRIPKLAEILVEPTGESFYRSMISHSKGPNNFVIGASEPETILSDRSRVPRFPGLAEYMMYVDMMTYLPDDILTKVDRASMAVGLEARVPFLDHRLVEFSWKVPTKFKFLDGNGKWMLREVLYRYVPRELMDRPKMGFGVPIDEWLRGPLREWGDRLLDQRRLEREGFFDPAPITNMWKEHVSGKRRWHYYLWDILMFQAWLEANPDAY